MPSSTNSASPRPPLRSRLSIKRTGAALVVIVILGACSPTTIDVVDSSTTTAPTTTFRPATTTSTSSTLPPPPPVLDPDGSYAVVAFTNHLPDYGTTPAGALNRPWPRLQTTRNYLTMVRLIAEQDAKVVLSFSPTLLEGISAAAAGRLDQAAMVTAVPAAELTTEERAYIHEVFFQASPAQIDRFPRYRELAERHTSGRTLSTTEYLDLQALFNLAWTSPLLLEEEPLLGLAAKGRGFTEADKALILESHRAALNEFLDSIAVLAATGSIELATTPLADPVLPLLVRNRMEEDAAEQIIRGHNAATAIFGLEPVGLVPNAGLIDQANLPAVNAAGYRWLLLAGDDGQQPALLTSEEGTLLALAAGPGHNMRVGQEYFGSDPNAAAFDVLRRLNEHIEAAPGRVVTLTADGTEPWGRYEDGGVAFLRSLLRQLGRANEFTTALPSDLALSVPFQPGPNPEVPRSFLSEPAELQAWAHMSESRRQLLRSRDIGTVAAAELDAAYELILQAQGRDWYRWYGSERSSGEDAFYDALFRGNLERAWTLLDEAPPDWTRIPLHDSPPVAPNRLDTSGGAAIEIDNRIAAAEWSRAGQYDERTSQLIRRVYFGFDRSTLFVRIDFTFEVLGDSAPGFDMYLGGPTATGAALTPLGNSIGFEADRVLSWRAVNPVRVSAVQPYPKRTGTDEQMVAGFDGTSMEFAVALDDIAPGLRAGDGIDFRIFDVTSGPEIGAFPAAGRGSFGVPNLEAGAELAVIADRLRDDYGPGTYAYLTDREIGAGTYDLAELAVRTFGPTEAAPEAAEEVQFEITFREPLTNPWNAPFGFSHQTVDVYVDADSAPGSGARRLLPGRVAATPPGTGWDYAVTIDGWGGAHFAADASGVTAPIESPVEFAVLSDRRTVLITVPRDALPPGDESAWTYGVAVLANQAIPTLGVHELRSLAVTPSRFSVGGGTGAINDPLIMDLLHPESGIQEESLTTPTALFSGDPATLDVSNLGLLPLIAG